MKDLEVLLLALPSAVMFGLTMYTKNIHEGDANRHAVTRGWTYRIRPSPRSKASCGQSFMGGSD